MNSVAASPSGFVRIAGPAMPLAFLVCGIVCASAAHAQPAVPALSGPVLDEAGLLSSAERNRLGERIRSIYESGGPQVQVWTFPSLEGGDIAQSGIAAADAWKLGRKGKDDGVILLVAQRERRTRLEVGRGLEGALPDILASRILREVLAPQLRAGRVYDGMTGVVAAVEQYARGEQPLGSAEPTQRERGGAERKSRVPFGALFPLLFIGFIVLQFILRLFGFGGGSRRGGFFVLPGSGGGGFGGRGGGGGWSGGGGGFSGGGSSGNW